MLPYWILFSVSAIVAMVRIDFQSIDPRNRTGLGILILAIMVMIGLRHDVGGDYYNYLSLHNELLYYDFADALVRTDPGYTAVDWAAGRLGYGTWVANMVCAALFCWGLWTFLRSMPSPFLGLVIAIPYLIIVVAMGYTRQAAALGFIMAAFASFDRTRVRRFIVLTMIAVLFHKSAIIMLPIGLLAISHNRLLSLTLLLTIGAALYYLFVSESIDRLVNNYVTQQLNSQGAMIRILMCTPPAILILTMPSRFRFTPDQRKLYRNLAVCTILALGALLAGVPSTSVDRLGLYLLPLQLIVYTRMTCLFAGDSRSAQFMAMGFILLYALVQYVWLNHAQNALYWVPYRFLPFS